MFLLEGFFCLFFRAYDYEKRKEEGKGKRIDRATTQCNVEGFLKCREREREISLIYGVRYMNRVYGLDVR